MANRQKVGDKVNKRVEKMRHQSIAALLEELGPDTVIEGDSLYDRAESYWNSASTQALAMVRPRTTEEVSRALSICCRYNQPVISQGGLTGCVQGAIAGPDEVILSLERMTCIESIDEIGATVIVQAGAILQTVQETVEEKGLLFPLDMGSRGSCSIGGNVATNAGGINVLRYGMMRNLVLGLEVVLADGSVLSSMNQMLKNNAGYDLKQLFIGSEGTLGIVTRAVLKLFPQPTTCNCALVAIESFAQVITLLKTLQRDLVGTLSAYEVMWGNYFRAVTDVGGHRAPMGRDYPFYVVVESEGATPETDNERFEYVLGQALEGNIIVDAILSKSGADRRTIWNIREIFDDILKPKPTYLYDISLPIKAMAVYVDQLEVELKLLWPNSLLHVFGHMADGNLHLFVQPGIEGDFHVDCDQAVYSLLKTFNGSISAEHGIGHEKKSWLQQSRNQSELNLMRALKLTLDPSNILNPGRVFDVA